MSNTYSKIAITALMVCTALAAAFGEPQDEAQNPAQPPPDSSFFVDPRDGKRYRTVKIGKQTWMAYNLNYKTGKSWCYDDDNSYCKKYGRLYDWNTAMKACPEGWRLPSIRDWNDLSKAVRRDDTKLRSKIGWDDNGNGTDAYGFSALPGGCHGEHNIPDGGVGECGAWWTSSEHGDDRAIYIEMHYKVEFLSSDDVSKDDVFSARCLKN